MANDWPHTHTEAHTSQLCLSLFLAFVKTLSEQKQQQEKKEWEEVQLQVTAGTH